MTLTDAEKLALLERYFTERPSPLFGERLRLMELAFAENPIWMKRKLAEIAPTPAERLNAVADIRRKQSPKRQGATAPIPGAFSAALSTVTATPSSIKAGTGTATITVVVKDVNGNPLPGVLVVLGATGTGNTLVQPKFPTFANGLATGTFSSTVGETKVVSATANGIAITQTAMVITEFLPSDVAGLEGWWKADAITGLVDADPVTTWLDSSGHGRDVTQATAANKPTYRTNVVNSKPVVRFDGTNDTLRNAAPAFAAPTQITGFCVGVRSGAPVFGMMVSINTTGTTFEVRWNNVGTSPQVAFAAGSATWGSVVTGVHLYQGEFNDPTDALAFRLDGGTAVTGSSTTALNTVAAIDLGARAATNFFSGDIAEVLIYSRILLTGERQDVETYLKGKYAIV